jgi:hypothetical protein
MMHAFFTCIALSASVRVNGLAFSHAHTPTTLPTCDIHQFPNHTWVENLAVHQNGQIVVTILSAPELYQVDPFHTDSPPTLIHHIPGVLGLLGIVELQHDVFYIIVSNWSVSTLRQPMEATHCGRLKWTPAMGQSIPLPSFQRLWIFLKECS